MPKHSQRGRPLSIKIDGLSDDALLLEKFAGAEAMSELFCFQLEMLAEEAVDFSKVLGQGATVTVKLRGQADRHIRGIVCRLAEGDQVAGADGLGTLIRYRGELVPPLWLLTQRVQSRIFQDVSVPNILEQVLKEWGLPFTAILSSEYVPRNYCVQYEESDFAFITRLMEEEGISYYFAHGTNALSCIITDTQRSAAAVGEVSYQRTVTGNEPRIFSWEKIQTTCTSRQQVRDYSFQVPQSELTRAATVTRTVKVGATRHELGRPYLVNGAEMLEVSRFPAALAHRFDVIDRRGAERPGHDRVLEQLFKDVERASKLRAEQEAARALTIRGAGNLAGFLPGHGFTFQKHFSADGKYVITRVEHHASQEGVYTAGEAHGPVYENRFVCLPEELPYRPEPRTPRPRIHGPQTAIVVGAEPPAPEASIDRLPPYVDKYGRVKVHFHWDRERACDTNSSCWLRVAQIWAGKRWGAFFWPRPGQEVVVAFQDGDPDRPLITGSVYNAGNMPPLPLPEAANACGIKSASAISDPLQDFNCVVFHDDPGVERLHIRSQTHDATSSGASRSFHTRGAVLETVGSLLVPPDNGNGGTDKSTPGVGSGATWNQPRSADEATPEPLPIRPRPTTRGGIDYLSWPGMFAALGLHSADNPDAGLAGLLDLPSQTNVTFGHAVRHILMGDNIRYVVGGDDVNYIFQSPHTWLPEALIRAVPALALPALGLPLALAGVGMIGANSEDWWKRLLMSVPGAIVTALPDPGGRTEMLVGKRFTHNYLGPIVQVERCKRYSYTDKSFLQIWNLEPASHAARLLTVAIYLTNTTAGILAQVFNTIDARGNVSYEHAAALTTATAGRKLHGVLQIIEESLAMARTAKADADAAVQKAKLALLNVGLAPTVDNGLQAPKSLKEAARWCLSKARQSLADLLASATADLTGKALATQTSDGTIAIDSNREAHTTTGAYEINADGNIAITANKSNLEFGAFRDPTDVLVNQRQGYRTGCVNMLAQSSIMLAAGQCTLGLLPDSTAVANQGQVTLENTGPGTIKIRQGAGGGDPLIQLESGNASSIELKVGFLRSDVKITTDEIILSQAAFPTITKICLDKQGATVTCGTSKVIVAKDKLTLSSGFAGIGSKIEMSSKGVTIEGLNVEIKGKINGKVECLKFDELVTLRNASDTIQKH